MYATEQLGERQSITPEGFLLCEAVPIARVGAQDYAYFELPEIEAKDGVIVAERTADVLFSPETLASFEGKPITIDHPPDFVTPANYMSVARGTVRNVRQGDGDQAELMLADPLKQVLDAIQATNGKIDALADRVTKLEGGGTPTGDGDGDDDDLDGTGTTDNDGTGEGGDDKTGARTGDSTALRDQFQDALSRAEILAPGVRLPTFDAKIARKKTVDAICVLRRRALRAALDNENAELVRSVVGGANVASMTCDSVAAFLNAASEVVRSKNSGVTQRRTNDSTQTERKDINEIHAEFWKVRK
ncbi:DUF2213 domain-containing protein [Burkholderia cenocepacia]|uniref:DUF2213 domain-containing protein n=1 Tax=Burkholderia cenocepacia TaxID=95486 RepID=UPI002158EC31|nr:DUF2213 domain-containing protein [Burkholderia cenocepacia]